MVDILMPRLSDTMEEGVVSAWRKQVGDEVHAGDVLVEIETDKAVMEHEAYQDGVLDEIIVGEGDAAPIGAPIARLRVAGEPEAAAPSAAAPAEAVAAAEAPPEAKPAPAAETAATQTAPAGEGVGQDGPRPAPVGATRNGERIRSSPLARRDAREYGIELATVTGTGPGGRIIRADVARAREQQAAAPAAAPGAATAASGAAGPVPAAPATPAAAPADSDEVVRLTPVRKTIARRLSQSKQEAPHYYVTKTIDAGPLMSLRAELNDRLVAAGRAKISVNDIIVRAAAVVLRDHPVVNSSFSDDSIIRHRRIHVGVAVATEAGLVVPVVRDADGKSLTTIAAETRELAGRARDRKLSPDEMSGGTFTVSNLGMYGIDHFTAVINPPEAAILAVGAVRSEPGVVDGEVRVVQRMTMTLSSDHRIIDGAQAAEFVRDLAAVLEDPWLAVA